MVRSSVLILVILVIGGFAVPRILAQSTEFVYQGQLQSAAAVANGTFDFEFALFDSVGSQIGGTMARSGVVVANGIFAVNLDFGSSFPGASRFLEIRVRQSGGGGYTTLSPRQPISSAPYSVKSLNAENAANATNAVTAASFTGSLNGDVTGTQNSTTVARLQSRNVAATAPAGGQVLKFNSATNQWQPDTDLTGSGGGAGTITGVTPGTGLAGGGTTGNVTLNIAPSGVGTTQLADGGVTDAKISTVSGNKVTGAVANATNAATATDALSLGGVAANQYLQINGNGSGLTNLSATNIATGTLANARLGQIPTANIGDSAVTALKIASGQVVKTLNGLTDVVTLAGSGGITVTPTGNTLTIASTADGNPILNQTTLQAGANFNIGGNGKVGGTFTANLVNALTQYYLNGSPILSAPFSQNLFAGEGTGSSNTSGSANSFFGYANGFANTSGGNNSFFGIGAGGSSTVGDQSAFFGAYAGSNNVGGSNNTAVGAYANVGSGSLTNANAFGWNARVDQSNSLVLGSIAGVNFATSTVNVGIGTTTPASRLDIAATGNGAELLRLSTERPWVFRQVRTGPSTGLQLFSTSGQKYFEITASDGTNIASFYGDGFSSKVGIGTTSPIATLDVAGSLKLDIIGGGGSVALCRNPNNFISTCSSSARYKTNVEQFPGGMQVIDRLRPVSFKWKEGGAADVGFVAEEVAGVEPLLVTYNEKGEVEGVKYDRLSTIFVNAFKEQHSLIEALQQKADASDRKSKLQSHDHEQIDARLAEAIKKQQAEIQTLKAINTTLLKRLGTIERSIRKPKPAGRSRSGARK